MLYDHWFKTPEDVPLLLEKIRKYSDRTGPIRLMEVCGTHTMSIARSGIRSILPENVQLLSGPGCPVCVTPANMIDMVLDLSQQPGVLITSLTAARRPYHKLRRSAARSRIKARGQPALPPRAWRKGRVRLFTHGCGPHRGRTPGYGSHFSWRRL